MTESRWDQLQDVYDELADDPRFDRLRQPSIRLVRGDGPTSANMPAKVMVVGEAPGAQENGAERPFVGASGRVLNSLLARGGLWRSDCFVTNIVKYRPMDGGRNTTPSLYHQMEGVDYVRREWSIIQPVLTICVGSVAHSMLTKGDLSLSATHRGDLQPFGRVDRPEWHANLQAYVTSQFHPAYGLRSPDRRPTMERDWDRMWEMCREVPGILCPACDGIGPREGELCSVCNPEGTREC